MQTKMYIFNRIILNTNTAHHRIPVRINRPRALRAKERGDPDGSKSVFGQLYQQLHFLKPSALRGSGQLWSVEYLGEGGMDAGGLFRDSISHACADLQSPYVPLFIPCPNSKGFGDNQEKFVPNPSSNSSLHLSMFAFVGKLMGISIRGKHLLNLDFPSIVWKPLVGSKLERSDLEAIDTFSYKMFDEVANAHTRSGVNEETFTNLIDLTFTATSADGREVELIPGGKDMKVTWQNRKEFVRLLESFRLHEFDVQVEAIKIGLATIVPIHLLSLFTWQELEMSVCGKREIDLRLLKENTNYSGCSSSDLHVKMFWEVLETFSAEERQMFLRFAWGRSRLPLSCEDFDQKFVIMPSSSNNDRVLPKSHTCFFQFELPRYSTKEIMKRKLLYAITECRAIDTDHTVQHNANWAEEDTNPEISEDI